VFVGAVRVQAAAVDDLQPNLLEHAEGLEKRRQETRLGDGFLEGDSDVLSDTVPAS
jgi:hypothetical protein